MRYRYVNAQIAFCVFLFLPPAFAQWTCRLVVRDSSGAVIGRIDSQSAFRDINGAAVGPAQHGVIRSSSGALVGRFENGLVRDFGGRTLGRVDKDGAILKSSGALIGRVEGDGRLRAASGRILGGIDSGGIIRNPGGSSRGRFDGYTPDCRLIAAAYLFFFDKTFLFN